VLPIPRIVWPVTIAAGVNDLVVFEASGESVSTVATGIVAADTYLTPEALAAAVRTGINGATDALAVAWGQDSDSAVSVSADGRVSVTLSGLSGGWVATLYTLGPPLWQAEEAYVVGQFVRTTAGRLYLCTASGTSAAFGNEPTGQTDPVADGAGTLVWSYRGRVEALRGLMAQLGFDTSANPATQTQQASELEATFTGTRQVPNFWSPGVPVRLDTEDREMESIVTQVETAAGLTRTTRWSPTTIGGRKRFRRLRFEWMEPHKVLASRATGDLVNQAFETFWTSPGVGRFRYSPDRESPATEAADLVLRGDSLLRMTPERAADTVDRYHLEIECARYLSALGVESP
jgi:hypothetical protein